MSQNSIRFDNKLNPDFINTVRKNVHQYFKENNISRHANGLMKRKTVFMLMLYLVPFSLVLFGGFDATWQQLILWAIMGFGMGGIGLSVMHDANHGAYSKNPKVNKLIGNVIVLVGGYSPNWKMQHNVLHHSFTNIEGHDEDIDPGGLLRFSPHAKRKGAHRFQHIYAWALYCLMTIIWATTKDFKQIFRYRDLDLIKTTGKTFNRLLTEVILTKAFYYAYIIGLPILLTDISPLVIIMGWLLMQFIAGFILAIIFQPAHVITSSAFPLPNEDGTIENNWAIHQLRTTSNFAPNSGWFSYYVGGLNFQVEHHLFPNICHVHYKKISKIVESTAKQFNLPYHSQPTFWNAITEHTKMLKKLGKMDHIPDPVMSA